MDINDKQKTPHVDLHTAHMEQRRQFLGVSDQLITAKVAYAFFLDRFQPQNIQDAQLYRELKKFEWFAGSLSLRSLTELISKFLASSHANALSPDLNEKLNDYVKMLQSAQEHYSQVDGILAKDIGLNFLAVTGNPIWTKIPFPRKLNQESFQAVVESSMQRIEALQPGESALFQGGTYIHVAPFTIRCPQSDIYEIHQYNTTSDRSWQFHNLEKVREFISIAFEAKLDPDEIKSDTSRHLSSELEGLIPLNNMGATPIRQPQQKNTCHTKGLLTLLCQHVGGGNPAEIDNNLAWNEFKCQFGEFLLDGDLIQDPSLRKLSQQKQEERQTKKAILDLMAKADASTQKEMIDKEYDQIIAKYNVMPQGYGAKQQEMQGTMLKKTDKYSSSTSESMPLKKHYSQLQESFKFLSASEIEEIGSHFSPVVCEIITLFARMEKGKEQQSIYEIKKEIEDLKLESTPLQKSLRQIKHQIINTEAYQSIRHSIIIPLQELLDSDSERDYSSLKSLYSQWKNIPKEDVQLFVDYFRSNPDLLGDLSDKGAIKNVLFQAIENGLVHPFLEIYEGMPKIGQENLQSFIRRTSDAVFDNIQSEQILDPALVAKISRYNLLRPFNRLVINTMTHALQTNRFDILKELIISMRTISNDLNSDDLNREGCLDREFDGIDFSTVDMDIKALLSWDVSRTIQRLAVNYSLAKRDIKPLIQLLKEPIEVSQNLFLILLRQAESKSIDQAMAEEIIAVCKQNPELLDSTSANQLIDFYIEHRFTDIFTEIYLQKGKDFHWGIQPQTVRKLRDKQLLIEPFNSIIRQGMKEWGPGHNLNILDASFFTVPGETVFEIMSQDPYNCRGNETAAQMLTLIEEIAEMDLNRDELASIQLALLAVNALKKHNEEEKEIQTYANELVEVNLKQDESAFQQALIKINTLKQENVAGCNLLKEFIEKNQSKLPKTCEIFDAHLHEQAG